MPRSQESCMWVDKYGTASGSDRVSRTLCSNLHVPFTPSLPRRVPYLFGAATCLYSKVEKEVNTAIRASSRLKFQVSQKADSYE